MDAPRRSVAPASACRGPRTGPAAGRRRGRGVGAAISARTSPRRTYRRPPSLMLCEAAGARPAADRGRREVDVGRARISAASARVIQSAAPAIVSRADVAAVARRLRPGARLRVARTSLALSASPSAVVVRRRRRRRPTRPSVEPSRRSCDAVEPALLLRPARPLEVDGRRGDRLADGPAAAQRAASSGRPSWTPWITSKRRPQVAQS